MWLLSASSEAIKSRYQGASRKSIFHHAQHKGSLLQVIDYSENSTCREVTEPAICAFFLGHSWATRVRSFRASLLSGVEQEDRIASCPAHHAVLNWIVRQARSGNAQKLFASVYLLGPVFEVIS